MTTPDSNSDSKADTGTDATHEAVDHQARYEQRVAERVAAMRHQTRKKGSLGNPALGGGFGAFGGSKTER